MQTLLFSFFFLLTSEARQRDWYPEQVVAIYESPDLKEKAELVNLAVSSTAYHYRVRIAQRYYLSEIYADVRMFAWSGDSKNFYFVAERKDGQVAVIENGVEHYSKFKFTSRPFWSSDYKQLVYWGCGKDQSFTVIWNGIAIQKYKSIIDLFFDANDNLVISGEEL